MNASTPPSPPNSLNSQLADRRMGLRKAHDTPRTSPKTPTRTRKDTKRIGPRKNKAREPGKEARSRYQEEREEWADGSV